MADSTSAIFYGYHNLATRVVGVFTCGLYVGSYTVSATGSVTVPFGSDVNGLFTLARTTAYNATGGWGNIGKKIDVHIGSDDFTYTIPCIIGFRYTSHGQLLRPAAESEIKSSQGSGLAKHRTISQIGVLLDNSIGVSFGQSFSELTAGVFVDAAGTALNHATMFSGVHQMPIIQDRQFYDSEVCWEITLPYPATVVSLTGFVHTEER